MLQNWIDFLSQLQQNNNTIWFHAHKDSYLKIKSEFEKFVLELLYEMVKMDPDLGLLTVKDCVYRINRDIRFTKDKSPYKTWLAASFEMGGKGSQKPTYYFHISCNGTATIAGGLYDPNKDQLKNFRQKLVDKPEGILKIINSSKFKKVFGDLSGEKLAKPARGFLATKDTQEILKHKNIIGHLNKNLTGFDNEKLKTELLADFSALKPLVVYLRKNV
jgi:uncharacterized protein (TIGR02453 family)